MFNPPSRLLKPVVLKQGSGDLKKSVKYSQGVRDFFFLNVKMVEIIQLLAYLTGRLNGFNPQLNNSKTIRPIQYIHGV